MARSRNIKPGFFSNDDLASLPALTRLLFIGLWTIADRDGRIEDRPKKIRAEVMPYDDCDPESMLQALCDLGFIHRYSAAGTRCIQVVNWAKHQNPHIKEQASTMQAPDLSSAKPEQAREEVKPCPEHAGLIPSLLIPDSLSLDSLEKRESTSPPRAAVASPHSRGSRLPTDWTPEPEHMAFAESLGLRNGRSGGELEKFRDYWIAQPGQKGVKTNWAATWRNWVRRATESIPGKPGSGAMDMDGIL